MTRINVIPVADLTDKHLLAEYRELPRISALAHNFAGPRNKIPATYRLGTGHVTFFYDKGEFLRHRFEEEIVPEMQRRGFTVNYTQYRAHPEGMNRDWTPTEESIIINRTRIETRIREALLRKSDKETKMAETLHNENAMKLTHLTEEHVCSCGSHITSIRQYNILGSEEGFLWFNCAICKSTRLVPETKVRVEDTTSTTTEAK